MDSDTLPYFRSAAPRQLMRPTRDPIEELRTAIDCLPVDTRVAMFDGIRGNDIIVGAYTDGRGGICPMLAAHRAGGRTNLISFAHSWDRFTRARGRARRASGRELRVLTEHLEASLLAENLPGLERAIVEHRDLVADRAQDAAGEPGEQIVARRLRRARPSERDRSRELRLRPGWAWLRPFRRFDEYEAALARVEAERDALAAEPAREPAGR